MSRQGKGGLLPIARRLRFMRGDATQEVFAKQLGISRSALANYETGRSTPDDFTLSRMAKNAGFPEDYFARQFEPTAEPSFARSIGQQMEGLPDWTDDEATLVRILRLCDQRTIREVLQMIVEDASRQQVTAQVRMFFRVNEDMQRLVDLGSAMRPFEKGSLSTYPEDSPLHGIGFKDKATKGPE